MTFSEELFLVIGWKAPARIFQLARNRRSLKLTAPLIFVASSLPVTTPTFVQSHLFKEHTKRSYKYKSGEMIVLF